jgi:hypothetical protein
MGYEINVALNGQHLFATHERSMSNMLLEQAVDMLHLMAEKFPESDGYHVTMTELRITRTRITTE